MISRRTFIALLPFALAKPALAGVHPSVTFMNQVGKDLLHAHRQGTTSAFMRVIQRYADVPGISNYLLGEYKVPAGSQAEYQRGVANFISQYFAEQSQKYPIAKFEMGEATVAENKDIFVASRVYLMSGQDYSVSWHLTWTGGTYKVSDVKMLGISLTYWERNDFTQFLRKNNGNVKVLIAALNRR
ncbi:MAG: ABC transporter substrate-binding protein [Alphaproteobacteria bacterium]|nr:ABC transporter substrate-binding protein [Alphaproteobacteria bacterium]